ncbi:MAG: hypothetical protein GY716_25745 [bacterium]|nr:hypothetical protein [bacterium]
MTSRPKTVAALLVSLSLLAAPALAQHHDQHDRRALEEDPRLAPGQLAPVLEGRGDNHFDVTTVSDRAQLFFDQGLSLTYGFNHQEALRAFKEAARLDPSCAMAYWGWALVLGPNLNLPMMDDVVAQAYEAIRSAVDMKEDVTPIERDLIEALARRYSEDPAADRAALNQAYADAMSEVFMAYRDNADVATLYAASLMNTTPWDYWTQDGQPKYGHIPNVIEALEHAIELDEQHEGALHYYIHIIEPVDAKRGERAADLLTGLAPGAGHLVHMPSHIYMQLGRYEDSYVANANASKADEGYITQCRAQGLYPLSYYPHNVHFLAWAATMQGRSADALAASRKVASKVPQDMHGNVWALYQSFLSMPVYVMVRFGMWDEMLAEPQPPEGTVLWTGMWHFGRGMAYAHVGPAKKAKKELAALNALVMDEETHAVPIGFSSAGTLLTIAQSVLTAELALQKGKVETGLAHLERAVRLEDSLMYNEPPDWFTPTRHYLGAALLHADRPVEAEVVYWRDLAKNKNNGFALFGLAQALEAQDKTEQAADVRRRLEESWSAADVKLLSSAF